MSVLHGCCLAKIHVQSSTKPFFTSIPFIQPSLPFILLHSNQILVFSFSPTSPRPLFTTCFFVFFQHNWGKLPKQYLQGCDEKLTFQRVPAEIFYLCPTPWFFSFSFLLFLSVFTGQNYSIFFFSRLSSEFPYTVWLAPKWLSYSHPDKPQNHPKVTALLSF